MLKKGTKRPHRFIEKTMMRELLPNLTGKKVLMLGCGTGEESLMLNEFGNLNGFDIMLKFIEGNQNNDDKEKKNDDIIMLIFYIFKIAFPFLYKPIFLSFTCRVGIYSLYI